MNVCLYIIGKAMPSQTKSSEPPFWLSRCLSSKHPLANHLHKEHQTSQYQYCAGDCKSDLGGHRMEHAFHSRLILAWVPSQGCFVVLLEGHLARQGRCTSEENPAAMFGVPVCSTR